MDAKILREKYKREVEKKGTKRKRENERERERRTERIICKI